MKREVDKSTQARLDLEADVALKPEQRARISDILSDPEALVCEKIAAQILGLTNYRTLAVWRSTRRHPDLRWRKIGRLVRYLVKDLVDYRNRERP